jgi:hypothetical protein
MVRVNVRAPLSTQADRAAVDSDGYAPVLVEIPDSAGGGGSQLSAGIVIYCCPTSRNDDKFGTDNLLCA